MRGEPSAALKERQLDHEGTTGDGGARLLDEALEGLQAMAADRSAG